MELTHLSLYELGKNLGRAVKCPNYPELEKFLISLGFGHIQISSKNKYPVIRIYDQNSPRLPIKMLSCYFQAGFFAGCLHTMRQEELDLQETKCLNMADNCCEFKVIPASRRSPSPFSPPDYPPPPPEIIKFLVNSCLDLQRQWLHPRGYSEAGRENWSKTREKNNLSSQVFTLDDLKGVSESVRSLKQMAVRAARSDFTVLLQGESGTGKEMLAHAIHHLSRRWEGPLISLNCAAVPDNLWEAEFFGYEEGSFTGAKKGGNPGKIELAHNGTLFLDEIGDIPLAMQGKLLRCLQYGEVQKLGSTRQLEVDVRLIAASNKNLTRLVEEGRFREDLYYRLNVICLEIPPLRERTEDIPVLVQHILGKLNRKYPEYGKEITSTALERLQKYVWPGNVRELENIIERTFSLLDSRVIDVNDLLAFLPPNLSPLNGRGHGSLRNSMSEIERELILEAIETAAGNRTRAAKILGLSRSTFHLKLKQHKIVLTED